MLRVYYITLVCDDLGFIQRKYWALKCWTEFEFWIYEGREFCVAIILNVIVCLGCIYNYITHGISLYIYNVSQQSIVTRHKTCIDLYMYDGFIECFMCDTIMNKINK